MLRILMIAYYFPPDSSSGAFRPLFFANHLQKMGAEITVLTVKESDFLEEQPVSYDLLEKLDTCVDVVRAGAVRPRECLIALKNKMIKAENVRLTGNNGLHNGDAAPSFTRKVKDTITDLLTCPDPHVGWVPGAVKKGMAVIGEKKIDVIWATGSPWSCFVAGALLRKKTGKPLVMDFRDPWVANPNFARRGRIAACIEQRLERILVKNSNSIIANTEALRRDFIRRYPFLSGSVHTITNGFEAYVASSECRERRKRFSIVHAGAIYFNRNPKALLEAVYQLMAEERFDSDLFRIVFVGGISAADSAVSDILAHPLLEKVVRVIPRVSYDRAMEYQIKADVLLLIQPDFPLQIPRKLYDYISLQRPILAITEKEGATANLITRYGLGRIVENEVASLKKIILELYLDWKHGVDGNRPEGQSQFKNSHLSKRLYEVLQDSV